MLYQGFVDLIGLVCIGGAIVAVVFGLAVGVVHLFAGPVDLD
jgi:hypothetical protein